jgi:hypothetical protein
MWVDTAGWNRDQTKGRKSGEPLLDSGQMQEDLSSSSASRPDQPYIQWIPEALPPRYEAHHLRLSSTKVKNNWKHTDFLAFAIMLCKGTEFSLYLLYF